MMELKAFEPETRPAVRRTAQVLTLPTAVKVSPFLVRGMNDCIETGKSKPPMTRLWDELVQSGENVIIFGDTGKGKTLLGVQLGEAWANGEQVILDLPNESEPKQVLLFDFELTDQNIAKRYQNYRFSDNLKRVTLDPKKFDQDWTFEEIREIIMQQGADIVIIDNISALSLRSLSDGDTALKVMRELHRIKLEYAETAKPLTTGNESNTNEY
jgi:KaiC/GvpD/RAD55 family RecA-like ATPase